MNRMERVRVLEEKQNSKKKLLILVFGIITVLVAIVGASFAYIAKRVDYVNGNESIQMGTIDVEGVTFQASDSINLKNAVPGDKANMNFTISNPNEKVKVRYTIKLVADVNEFDTKDGEGQLLITLNNENMEEPNVVDFTDGENMQSAIMISRVELEPKQSDVYELNLEFKELDSNQNSNQKKNFTGHIEVTQTLVVNSKN